MNGTGEHPTVPVSTVDTEALPADLGKPRHEPDLGAKVGIITGGALLALTITLLVVAMTVR